MDFDPRDHDLRETDGRDIHDPRDTFMRDLDLPRGADRQIVRDRDHEYTLRGSDTRTLSTVGAFRVVPAGRLRDHSGAPCQGSRCGQTSGRSTVAQVPSFWPVKLPDAPEQCGPNRAAQVEAEMAEKDFGDAFPGIDVTEGVSGGDSCIARTRIPVWVLEYARWLGASEPELLRSYPSLRP